MNVLKKLWHLWLIGTPIKIFFHLLLSAIRLPSLRRRYKLEIDRFNEQFRRAQCGARWPSFSFPFWLEAFEKFGFEGKPVKALEIGSWEGMSCMFILGQLPNCKITCVDTWEGGLEHKTFHDLNQIELRFDQNTSVFKERITKFKGTSHLFLSSISTQTRYDLIYVDGSHRGDDVLVDAIKSFELLETNGIMIFDDYLWIRYRERLNNPSAAINAFLYLKRGHYEILAAHWQLIIRKISESDYTLKTKHA